MKKTSFWHRFCRIENGKKKMVVWARAKNRMARQAGEKMTLFILIFYMKLGHSNWLVVPRKGD